MTDEQLQHALETGKQKLNFSEKFTHYRIVFFFLMIPAIVIFFYLKDVYGGEVEPVKQGTFWASIAAIVIAILFYFLQKKTLNFESVETRMSRRDLDKIIGSVAKKLKWNLHLSTKKLIVGNTDPGFLSGSWGEQITIIFDQNRILVNSICDPHKKGSVVSMGRNKKNVETLIEAINNAGRNSKRN